MHLALMIGSVGGHSGAWRRPSSRVEELTSLSLYRDLATAAENAKFDAVFMADELSIAPARLRSGGAMARLEPMTLLSALTTCTSSIGLIGSISTTFTEPYNVARQLASLDHLSAGRAGWNVVTSVHGERNFGGGALPDHVTRYERADEHVRAAKALWDSWSDDAIVLDRAMGTYAVPSRVRSPGFAERFFRVEGPLNVPRPPQGHPVIVQAGASADGMEFAARHADALFTSHQTKLEAIAFADRFRSLLVRNGRDSSSIRILAAISPRLAATQDRAEEIAGQLSQLIDLEVGLGRLELRMGNIQLRDLDPDQRIPADRLPPAEEIEGGQGLYTTFRTLALDQGLSLRQLIDVESAAYGLWSPVGSPESVAEEMIDWCKDGACDGFNVHPAYLPEGADLFFNSVVPILRERGMFRDEYSGSQLRSHLGLPRPKMVFDEVSSDTGQLT